MLSWGRFPSWYPDWAAQAITSGYCSSLHQLALLRRVSFHYLSNCFSSKQFWLHFSLLFARLEKPSSLVAFLGKHVAPGHPGSLPLDPPHFLHISADLGTPWLKHSIQRGTRRTQELSCGSAKLLLTRRTKFGQPIHGANHSCAICAMKLQPERKRSRW